MPSGKRLIPQSIIKSTKEALFFIRRSWENYRPRRINIAVWSVTATCWAFMTFSAYPGWMSADSIWMYQMATGFETPNDHHTPWLIGAWKLLWPEKLGPILPLLLQQSIFWVSVGVISAKISKINPKAALVLPVALFLLDHSWVLGWIWKDAAALAAGIMSLAFLVDFLQNPRRKTFLWGLFFLGLTVSIRWYLIFASLFLVFVIISFAIKRLKPAKSGTSSLRKNTKVVTCILGISIFSAGYAGPILSTTLILEEVKPNYSVGQTLLWDLVRIQCETSSRPTVIPKIFIEGPEEDTCKTFNSLDLWSVLPLGEEKIRFATSDQEQRLLLDAWFVEAPKEKFFLLENKVLLSVYLLRVADPWVVPSYDLPAGVTKVQQQGGLAPGVGENFLSVSRLHTAVLSLGGPLLNVFNSGYLWLIIIPIFAINRVRFTKPLPMSVVLGVYSFPCLWVLGMGFVSPWTDTRYVAVAVVWSLVWSAYLLSFKNNQHSLTATG